MTRFQRFLLRIAILLFITAPLSAEPAELVVRGRVLEQGTRKPLEGMTVYAVEQETESVETGKNGGFSLSVKTPGEFTLAAAGTGYNQSKPLKISIHESKKTKEVILYLQPVYAMREVVVQADRNPDKTAKTAISGKELTSMAGSMGDPLRGMQALPGMTTTNDASSNPAIRGSSPRSNLYYADFMPTGYLFHMGGWESVLNGDIVEDFNIYPSSFGPEFGNVTGGVIDVKLRNPRTDRLGGKINISTLEADWLLEGPIAKGQSFYVSARRSYIDLLMEENTKSDGIIIRQYPQYDDFQAKYLYTLSDDHSLTIYANGANDRMKFTFTSEADIVKHDPIFAGDFNFEESYNTLGAVLTSKVSPLVNNKFGISYLDTSVKQKFTQLGHITTGSSTLFMRDQVIIAATENNEILFGVDYAFLRYKVDFDLPKVVPTEFDPNPDFSSAERVFFNRRLTGYERGIALKDRWKVTDLLILVAGGHASYDSYLDKNLVEPRLSAEYAVVKSTLLTAGWGKYHQFPPPMMVVEEFGNRHLDYDKADHYDVGVEHQAGSGWSVKVDEYYKKLYHLPVSHRPENVVNGGSGKAYGTEFLLKKDRTDSWWGWLSVAYARTKRHNDMTGQDFPAAYDQPCIINMVYNWKLTPMWTFGAKWRYQSGGTFTPVVDTYNDAEGRIRPLYGDLNSERLPAYHRLDLRVSAEVWARMQKVSFYVDILNVYNRKNISGYEYNADYTSRTPVEELPTIAGIGIQVEF